MPKPHPVARKYKSIIDEAVDNLRYIAHQVTLVLEALETSRRSMQQVETMLREIEAMAYKTALALSEIDVADDCTSCPLAPPVTKYQVSLTFILKQLLKIVAEIRKILGELDE